MAGSDQREATIQKIQSKSKLQTFLDGFGWNLISSLQHQLRSSIELRNHQYSVWLSLSSANAEWSACVWCRHKALHSLRKCERLRGITNDDSPCSIRISFLFNRLLKKILQILLSLSSSDQNSYQSLVIIKIWWMKRNFKSSERP